MPTMNMRKAKRDIAEGPIVEALKKAGATIVKLSDRGVPDLLVGYQNQNYLIEVKTGNGKLTEDEEKFFDGWKGYALIARNPESALSIIGIPEDQYHIYIAK